MVDLTEVKELLVTLCGDSTISRSTKETLVCLKDELSDEKSNDISMRINSALGKLEYISADPNLSADVRTWLWRLASLLEGAQNNK